MKPEKQKRLKICLLVGEYFGAMGTLYGGYGFLARHIVAKLISKYSEIDVEVCLGKRQDRKFSFARYMAPKEEIVDDVRVFRLPRSPYFARRFENRVEALDQPFPRRREMAQRVRRVRENRRGVCSANTKSYLAKKMSKQISLARVRALPRQG